MPYSLRRGGASHLFLRTGNMHVVQSRGRWQNLQTAKIYVDECVSCYLHHVNQSRLGAVRRVLLCRSQHVSGHVH
eukprot:4461584-Karenia_brevis.AAC.1